MKTTTTNEFCVPGRFWTTLPARERSEEEREALLALLALEAEGKEALAEWLEE